MDSGFIISRLLLIDLAPELEKCMQGVSEGGGYLAADKWLGRCIKRVSKAAVECTNEEEVRKQLVYCLSSHFLAFKKMSFFVRFCLVAICDGCCSY